MSLLPQKTVERLSQYRRVLLTCELIGKDFIFSHELAHQLHLTPVQVRRDIMLMGHSGKLRHGYNIKDLIARIGTIIDPDETQRVAIIGAGNLGRAILNYLKEQKTKLQIVAAFDNNPDKIGELISGIQCYDIENLEQIIAEQGISIGIITVPARAAYKLSKRMAAAGIKGILNYSPASLSVENGTYLEEYDMITSIEKVSYFAKHQQKFEPFNFPKPQN